MDYNDLLNNKNISNINISQKEDINKLKNDLIKANKIIEQQNKKIKDLENQLNNNNNNNIIKSLENEIKLKNKEINELKLKLKNTNLNKDVINIHKESIKCVYFTSMDQKIHYPIPCLSTDIFAEIEEKLYKEYPEYRETNNFFIANGKEILRFKSISDNNIGNGLPVMLCIPEK